MRLQNRILIAISLVCAPSLSTQVRQVGDLKTRGIRPLDHAKTVDILQVGLLEEHGHYLPGFTDGILGDRLTHELTDGDVRQRLGWTVLVCPQKRLAAWLALRPH